MGGAVLALGSGLVNPSLSALMSLSAPECRQGSALGLGQSASALGRVRGPTLAGFLFALQVGLPFLVGGALMVLGTALALGLPRRQRAPVA